ncbi:hypothetical protein ONZ45_g6802 [Pleurotus djamor]|nr:hypothetical protein ONZ45_g6802 [Pleurotus djamor]
MPPWTSVPPEIWVCILSFLDDSETRVAALLNHFFCDLTVQFRHRHLRVTEFTCETTARLRHLNASPHITQIIKSIHIDFSLFAPTTKLVEHSREPQGARSKFLRCFSWRLSKRSNYEARPSIDLLSSQTISDLFVDLKPRCPNLEEVHVSEKTFNDDPDDLMELREIVLGCFLKDVTSLTLHHMLVPHAEEIMATHLRSSRLRHLSIQLVCRYFSGTSDAFMSFTQLLSKVMRTVEFLRLDVTGFQDATACSSLFSKLGKYQNTRRLEVHASPNYNYQVLSAIISFLNLQDHYLQELHLSLNWDHEVLFPYALALTALRKLHLSLPARLSRPKDFNPGQFRFPQLEELDIFAPTYQLPVVSAISEAFLTFETAIHLRSLSLEVLQFSEASLPRFAVIFPALRTLTVSATTFYPDEAVSKEPCSDWVLYDLTIRQLAMGETYLPLYAAMERIAGYIPSVRSFGGTNNMDRPARYAE